MCEMIRTFLSFGSSFKEEAMKIHSSFLSEITYAECPVVLPQQVVIVNETYGPLLGVLALIPAYFDIVSSIIEDVPSVAFHVP